MAPARPPNRRQAADGRARCARRRRYEAYLDHHITAADLYFLDSAAVARQLVELGCGAPAPAPHSLTEACCAPHVLGRVLSSACNHSACETADLRRAELLPPSRQR